MSPAIALCTYLTLGALLVGLFAGSGRLVDGRTRQAIADWLGRRTDSDAWTTTFLGWFDQVFRVRTRRLPVLGEVPLPSLWRSVVVSFLSLAVLAGIWVVNKDEFSRPLAHEPGVFSTQQITWLFIVYGGATVVTNWIPDFLSLIESRWVIGRMSRSRSIFGKVVWLGADLIFTGFIAFGAIFVGEMVVLPLVPEWMDIEVGCFTAESFELEDAWAIFVAGLKFESPPGALNFDAAGIYVYSTFLTSFWIWVYMAAGHLLRFVAKVRPEASRGLGMRALASVALVAFTATFWAAYAGQEREIDVWIGHGAGEVLEAERVADSLRAEGMHVMVERDAPDAMLDAELVMFVNGPLADPRDWGRYDEQLTTLWRDAECGARPWGTWTGADARDTAGAAHWAKTAPSLLGRDQVHQCRELDGLPPAPACPAR